MKSSVHLMFAGQCEEAFRFYECCGIGKVGFLLKYGESPMAAQAADDLFGKVLHANLKVGSTTISGVDVRTAEYVHPRGFYVLLEIEMESDAERIFEALSYGGRITIKLQKTFWAKRFGVVTDRFGVPWEVNCPEATLRTL